MIFYHHVIEGEVLAPFRVAAGQHGALGDLVFAAQQTGELFFGLFWGKAGQESQLAQVDSHNWNLFVYRRFNHTQQTAVSPYNATGVRLFQ